MNLKISLVIFPLLLVLTSCSLYESTFKNMANSYYQEKKCNRTIKPYMEAAKKGDINAMFELGKIYYYGIGGTRRNPDLAEYWYDKAAEKGGYEPTCKLAEMYLKGNNIDRNYYKAIEYADMADFLYNPEINKTNRAINIRNQAENANSRYKTRKLPGYTMGY